MEFSRFTIEGVTKGFVKHYKIFDDGKKLIYYTKRTKLGGTTQVVYDKQGNEFIQIKRNAWMNKYNILQKEGSKLKILALIEIAHGARLKMKIDSQNLGYLELYNKKIMDGEYVLRDPDSNELAVFIRKMESFSYKYGAATYSVEMIHLIVAIFIAAAWASDNGSI